MAPWRGVLINNPRASRLLGGTRVVSNRVRDSRQRLQRGREPGNGKVASEGARRGRRAARHQQRRFSYDPPLHFAGLHLRPMGSLPVPAFAPMRRRRQVRTAARLGHQPVASGASRLAHKCSYAPCGALTVSAVRGGRRCLGFQCEVCGLLSARSVEKSKRAT